MTYANVESCITVASMATHLFGLGDGHSFTIRDGHTHTQTRTYVSKHMGAVQGWARDTGSAGVPMLPRGVGVMDKSCHW